jgi:hypothetical protein
VYHKLLETNALLQKKHKEIGTKVNIFKTNEEYNAECTKGEGKVQSLRHIVDTIMQPACLM